MWRVMDLVYQTIHAALLPVRLHDLPKFIGVFLEHIGRRNEKKRPKQTEIFRASLQLSVAATGPDAGARFTCPPSAPA